MKEKPIDTIRALRKATSFERLIRIRKQFAKEKLNSFGHDEHFMELVADIGGVYLINNSSSVDIDSTWYAMDQINGPIVWVTAGVDRGNNYNLLKELVRDKVKAIVVLGEHNLNVFKFFGNDGPNLIVNASHMDEAIEHAIVMSSKGDTVLFSPGCPSYDLYENWEERGKDFKRAVSKLVK
jgi:UDP-N-acetylmuramoylalanine--D-glutamate ligase